MIAVIFEVNPFSEHRQSYLDIAAELKTLLQTIPGFISIERFQSLQDADKLLSLSFWQDEESVKVWRNLEQHRDAQSAGRATIFEDYRIRIAEVSRDYGMHERHEAPNDSQKRHAPKPV